MIEAVKWCDATDRDFYLCCYQSKFCCCYQKCTKSL